MQVATDLLIRNFEWADLPAITDLYNFCQEYDHLDGRVTLEEMENEWRSPVYDPEHEYLVVYNPDNQLIAYGWTEKSELASRGWGGTYVHPDYRGQGLGTYLLRTTDNDYLNRVADQVDSETPIYVQRWSPESKQDTIDLLEREGYFRARTFYTMRIDLDHPLEPVTMPEGFYLKPFDPATDAQAVYQAHQESFRDHWGHEVDTPFEEWNTRLTDPLFDPALWFIAYEGNNVAGVSLCSVWGSDIPELAWVGTLGVRRPWRKRGLAMALLKHSFYVFQQRGFTKGGLGVDASNPSGAVALYERAGMHVYKRGFSYRKVLRGNPDLLKD